MPPSIYLDHNATSPILPEVAEGMREAALRYPGNPESQHSVGRQARQVLEDAREAIGRMLGARLDGMTADRVIFTSGGTEANNLAFTGITQGFAPGRIVVADIEHPCVLESALHLQQDGWEVVRVAAEQYGMISLDQFTEALGADTRFTSLMLANNETGVLQPVMKIAEWCTERNILFHTDASQAVGRIPVHFADLGVAALCCSAHKFHGPLGIGVLLLRHDVPLMPALLGGHQQAALRPGTECVALAVGMRIALEIWNRDAEERMQRWGRLRDQFEQLVLESIPEAQVIGSTCPRLPNTSNISFVGFDRQALVMALDMEGVACSTGSACASGSSEPSPTLLGMGLDLAIIEGSLRFSLGALTTTADIQQAAQRILSVCKRLRPVRNR